MKKETQAANKKTHSAHLTALLITPMSARKKKLNICTHKRHKNSQKFLWTLTTSVGVRFSKIPPCWAPTRQAKYAHPELQLSQSSKLSRALVSRQIGQFFFVDCNNYKDILTALVPRPASAPEMRHMGRQRWDFFRVFFHMSRTLVFLCVCVCGRCIKVGRFSDACFQASGVKVAHKQLSAKALCEHTMINILNFEFHDFALQIRV